MYDGSSYQSHYIEVMRLKFQAYLIYKILYHKEGQSGAGSSAKFTQSEELAYETFIKKYPNQTITVRTFFSYLWKLRLLTIPLGDLLEKKK